MRFFRNKIIDYRGTSNMDLLEATPVNWNNICSTKPSSCDICLILRAFTCTMPLIYIIFLSGRYHICTCSCRLSKECDDFNSFSSLFVAS